MADKVDFELVSPERLLISQAVDMVVVPGSEGYFGVLPGHAPMIVQVRPGVIDMYEGDRVVDRLFVAGGFAEVNEKRCTVLAEEAVPVVALDRSAVEQQIRNLTEDLQDSKDDEQKVKLEARLDVARAKLEVLEGPGATH